MTAINLLPEELKPKGTVLKFSTTLKKIAKVVFVIFMVCSVVLLGTFLVLTNQIKTSKNKQSNLKLQIKALEETEQRLFLLKDRLLKIGDIVSGEDASEEIEIFGNFAAMLGEEVVIKEASLDKNKAEIIVFTSSSTNLSKLLTSLIAGGDFREIKLVSLQFTPDKGYRMGLSLAK